MRVLLSNAFGASLCPYYDWDELIAAGGKMLRHYNAYSGHYGIALDSFLGIALRRFTLLRDPVARTISHYLHVKRNRKHPYHAVVAGQSLNEFVCSPLTAHMVFNFQARYLAGARIDLPDLAKRFEIDPEKSKSLAIAWEHATFAMDSDQIRQDAIETFQRLEYVGLTEEFDRSLQDIARHFGFQPVASEHLNVAPAESKAGILDAKTERLIRERTAIDQELINMAKRRLVGDPKAATGSHAPRDIAPAEINHMAEQIGELVHGSDLAGELKAVRAEALAMAKHRDELKLISDDAERRARNEKARADYLEESRDKALAFAMSEQAHARTAAGKTAEAAQYAKSLENELNEARLQANLEREAREQLLRSAGEESARHEERVRSIEAYVESLRAAVAERDEQIGELQRYVTSLKAALAERDVALAEAQQYVESLDAALRQRDSALREAEQYVGSLRAFIADRDVASRSAEEYATSLRLALEQRDRAAGGARDHIASLTAELELRTAALQEAEQRVASLRAAVDRRAVALRKAASYVKSLRGALGW